ncbi:ATP synthase F1 subunit gamma [Candidatus Gracilibacteria bacterium]|nr:ATP synthase F1 subunit gamma [Candidatus Gracilibacteria bacterium]
MSGSLLEVKKKISGVKNTRKITKAMQLVAASKMQRFQKRAIHSRAYTWDLLKILKSNLKEEDSSSIFTEERKSGKTLFVLYTSDKGLCGSLNTKLINCLFRSNKWNDLAENERMLITIGKKSDAYTTNNKIAVEKKFIEIPEKLNNLDAIKVIDSILEIWKKGEAKEVVLISPHYKNSFTTYPVIKSFLPFTNKTIKDTLGVDADLEPKEEENENKFMYFSPSEEQVLERLYEQVIQAMFIQSFLELKASEYSSRMIAMQNATDAADRMINDLKRVYNKARQQSITQQIAELIGASMAMEEST